MVFPWRGVCDPPPVPQVLGERSSAVERSAADEEAADGMASRVLNLVEGYVRLSLRSPAQPLYTRSPIMFSSCFSKATIAGELAEVAAQQKSRGEGGGGARAEEAAAQPAEAPVCRASIFIDTLCP
jgi:hypothetical protein